MKVWLIEFIKEVLVKAKSAKLWGFIIACIFFQSGQLSENGWLIAFGFFVGANLMQKGIFTVTRTKESDKLEVVHDE